MAESSHGRFSSALLVILVHCQLAAAQPSSGNSTLLAHTRDKVLRLAERIPRYTCVQTMNRSYYEDEVKRPRTCDELAGEATRKPRSLSLAATDRVRLDVIVTDGQEIFSWAGASRFDPRWVGQLIGEGPVGTGPFGPFLLDVLQNDGVSFEFVGATQLHGHEVVEYAYQVPEKSSHYYTRRTDRNWIATAFSGSLYINGADEELERLTVHTNELPADTGACTADTLVDYQSLQLGSGGFLLPLENELHFLLRSGEESNNISTYTKCREYTAESTLIPSSDTPAAAPSEAQPTQSSAIRNGLKLVLVLKTPIDTDQAAAGDSISAVVKNDVRDTHSRAVVIHAGALARGRIVRMEHRLRPSPHFLVSISWNQLVSQGVATPFYARIDQPDPDQIRERTAFLGTRETIWLPPPGESKRAGGWFIEPTSKPRHLFPAGLTTHWVTADAPQDSEPATRAR